MYHLLAGYIPMCLLVLVIHELGHVLAGRLLGSRFIGAGFSWKGPYVRLSKAEPKVALLIALAGPITNIACGFLVYWFPLFGVLNLVFGYINLLPLPWSDSANAYRAWKKI